MEVERDVSVGADGLRVNTRLPSLLPIRRNSRRSTGAPGDVVDVGAVGRPVPILPDGAPDLGLDAVVARDGRRMAAAHGGDAVGEEMHGGLLATAEKTRTVEATEPTE